MCVCAAEAELSGTVLYHGRAAHPAHGTIHVLGYQNIVRNLAGGPNAMLLHLPGKGVSPANFIDTSGCPKILQDMVSAVRPRSRGMGRAPAPAMAADAFEVFEHDIYTVILAEDARVIPAALAHVPEARRVRISRELMEFYADRFPDCAMALCCFDNRDAQQANPLLLWYQPHEPDLYRLPAIDCHTGGVPDLDAQVDTDHWVILGTDEAPASWGARVYYGHVEGPAAGFLPDRVIGRAFTGRHRNGDFMITHEDVLQADLSGLRRA